MLPHKVEYTDKVKGGDAKYFKIRINPKYRGDEGLIAHEYEHIVQWYVAMAFTVVLIVLLYFTVSTYAIYYLPVAFFVHNSLYRFRWYRKYSEASAIREQLRHYDPKMIHWGAERLASDYDLNMSKSEALNALME